MVECLDGIDAITNHGYVLVNPTDSSVVPLKYPKIPMPTTTTDNDDGDDDKKRRRPFGKGFHHGRFIMNLRKACREVKQNLTILEATVNSLLTKDSCSELPPSADDAYHEVIGVKSTLKVGDEKLVKTFRAPVTFVCDGCFSKFRKEIEHKDVLVRSHFVGAILEDCPLLAPNNGHVILSQPSPILLYQIGTHDTRVLVDVPGKLPSASSGALKDYMLEKVMPQLPPQVQPCFEKACKEQRLRSMPNSFLPAKINKRPGVVVIGDAMNMRHPLTGGGMTVAFCDVVCLTRLLSKENVPDLADKKMVKDALSKFYYERKNHSTAINVLAQALYELFSAGSDPSLQLLRRATFEYLALGGIFESHPVGLLAGIIQNPIILYSHFFAVAFYAMFVLVLGTPHPALASYQISKTFVSDLESLNFVLGVVANLLKFIVWFFLVALSFPLNVYQGFNVIWTASSVLLPLIWTEMRTK